MAAVSPPSQAVDFTGIPPAETLAESHARLGARIARVLEWFAELPLPGESDEDPDPNNNPQLDSRTDVRHVTDRATARILLGMPTDEVAEIILDPRTNAFAIPGSSNAKSDPDDLCHRNGDYDFAMINWLRLAYIAKAHPGMLRQDAYLKIVKELLTVSGNEHSKTFRLVCLGIPINLEDTENHILMLEVSRYLTNQLLAELPENAGNVTYDNELNDNNAWMLHYLSAFLREMFDEYNSRPYQGFTILALSVLNSYAADTRVALAAGMLLDLISGMTAIQTNQLRRFSPFRRQPEYILPEKIHERNGWYSWSGDGEPERLGLLVGNYGYLEALNFDLPKGDGQCHFILTAASGAYRMDDVLLDLAIREDGRPRYFIGRHDNVEIYSSTASALISAGGHFQEAAPPAVEGLPSILRKIVEPIVSSITDKQHGWPRPTTLTPTRELSSDFRDMIRFEGHQDLKQRENICVGPGFACGLTPLLGNVVEPVAEYCSVTEGDWRFFDFHSVECPLDYGFYLALFDRPCDSDSCRERSETDRYGLMEIGEADSMSFSEFKEAVLQNNPNGFDSSGVHSYKTIVGHNIDFEINPSSGRSALVAIDGVKLDRDYRNWALARGDTMQSTTPGRVTFDSPGIRKRLILDMTQPQQPRRITTDLPGLRREQSVGGDGGRFFDDGGAVIRGQGVSWVALRSGERVDGIAMGWQSGLESSHGGDAGESKLVFEEGEIITEVGIGVTDVYDRQGIGLLRIRTNLGRELKGGAAAEQFTFTVEPGEQIIAFHGRAGEEIDSLGLIIEAMADDDPDRDAGVPDDGGDEPDTSSSDTEIDSAGEDTDSDTSNDHPDLSDDEDVIGQTTTSGCACLMSGAPRSSPWAIALPVIAILLWRGRRRRS